MNIDTHSEEQINSGDDRHILTQEMGRRVSLLEIALTNVRIANSYTRPHLSKSLMDIEDKLMKHYTRKDYSQTKSLGQEVISTSYDKEIAKLNPEARTEFTAPTNIDQARSDVAQYAASGVLDIEEYLAGQITENV